jgi:tripartite-type tricarboxylate transporter receptor subunit TctC
MTKTPSTQRRLLMALLGAVCTTSALPLWAQSTGNNTVKLIVGYAPGGPVDS